MGSKKLETRKLFLRGLVGKRIDMIVLVEGDNQIRINRNGVLVREDNEQRQGFYVNHSEGFFKIPARYVRISGSSRRTGEEKVIVRLPKDYNLNSLQTY